MSDHLFPPPVFNFSVDLGPCKNVPFRELSEMELPQKPSHPAEKKTRVTLLRGVFPNDAAFREWYSQAANGSLSPSGIFIRLLNEKGAITTSWMLKQAMITKIKGDAPDADGNEVAVERIEISCDEMAAQP